MTDDPRCSKDFQWLESRIVEHRSIAKDTWELTLEAPNLARWTLPGQFFMVRLAGLNDPLIGRALAMFDRGLDSQGNPQTVSVAYVVKGKYTQALSRFKAGQTVEIWGPLGNAFSNQPVDHLILVAGGVGITPMLSLSSAALGQGTYSQEGNFAKQVTLCYGARTQEYLVALDVFEARGVRLAIATEDGSLGHRGRVTEVLKDLLSRSEGTSRIACCGPEPMMQAVSKIAHEHNVPCEVSLETPMACGIGICFTCVAKIDQGDGTWDYRRTCVEGPIFESQSIVW